MSENRQYLSNLIRLAVPISLQNLITFAVGFADNVMIGRLGDSAISGVYMGSMLQTVLLIFTVGIDGAVLILAAQYWGKKDTGSIKKILSIGVKFSLALGIIFSSLGIFFPKFVLSWFTNDVSIIETGSEYLSIISFSFMFFTLSQVMISAMRSVEVAKIGLYVSILALVANVGLNYMFIFGVNGIIPAMGVKGAALGTLISRVIECLFILYYVRFRDKKLLLKFKDLISIDKIILRDFLKYGLPVFGGQIVWGCNLIANSVILGRFSESVISATSVTGMLHNLLFVWIGGLSASVGIITGKTVGEGDIERVKRNAKLVQIMFLIVGIISGLIIFLIKDGFIGLYNISDEAIAYSNQFMNVISITIIGSCYQATCLFGLVKSGGDVGFVFKNDTIFVFLVVIPSAAIAAVLGAAPWIVFALLKIDQILKCFVAVVKINSFNWIKDLTQKDDKDIIEKSILNKVKE